MNKKNLEGVFLKIGKSSLFKDSFWALIGSVIGKGLSLLAGILVARFLGKEMYGEYGIIKNTLLNIAVFSTLGLGYTGTRFIAKSLSDNSFEVTHTIRLIYRITVVASLSMALVVFFFASPIATFIKAPEMDSALRLTSLIVIFNAVNTSQIGILSGFKEFKRLAKNNAYAGLVTFVSSGLFACLWGFNGALLALLLSMGFNVIINHYSIYRLEREKVFYTLSSNTIGVKEIISFSIPIALQESMYTIVHFLSSYLLIIYGGYGELGITSAAAQWGGIMLFIPSVMKNVMLSYFSSSKTTSLLRNKMMLINGVATFVPWILIVLLSRFISSFYGTSFDGLHIVLSIVCLTSVFSSVSSVIVYEFISIGKNWEMFFLRFFRDSLSLLLAWLLLAHINSIRASFLSAAVYMTVGFFFMLLLLVIAPKMSNQSSLS